jgi:hypothetical protein
MIPPKKLFARLWIWFTQGWAVASIFLSMGNTGMAFITMLTVKGIYVPLWVIVFFVLCICVGVLLIGYKWYKSNIQAEVQSYSNNNANPEWNEHTVQANEDHELLLKIAEKIGVSK